MNDITSVKAGCLAVTPDGRRVISVGRDKNNAEILLVWELGESSRVIEIGHDMITSVAISPDGRLAAAASAQSRIVIVFDLDSGRPVRELIDDTGSRKVAVAVSPDRRFAISGGDKGDITCWDMEKGEAVFRLFHHIVNTREPNFWQHPGQFVHSVAFFDHGLKIMSAAGDGTIRLWDVKTGKQLSYTDLKTSLVSCVISSDGKHIFAGDKSGQLYSLTPGDFVKAV